MLFNINSIVIYNSGLSKPPFGWLQLCNFKAQYNRLYFPLTGGAGYIDKDGNKIPFKPGTLYFLPSGKNCEYYLDDSDNFLHVFFDFFSFAPCRTNNILCFDVSKVDYIKKHIDFIISYFSHHNISSSHYNPDSSNGNHITHQQIIHYMLINLLNMMSDYWQLEWSENSRLHPAMKYIENNYSQNITLEALAKLSHLSVAHFQKNFKEIYGVSPHRFIKRFRMQIAMDMLLQGAPPTMVYDKVGYISYPSFSSSFKRIFNISPADIYHNNFDEHISDNNE